MVGPLAFAQLYSSDKYELILQEETQQDGQGTYNSYVTEQDKGSDLGTEYEEQEVPPLMKRRMIRASNCNL
tara:strand:+ start:1610 stop:1822 length:213 start_codon:yes stop_codon:yes gene_type:complete